MSKWFFFSLLARFKLDYGPAAQVYCLKEYGLPQSENAECDQKLNSHPRIAEVFKKLMTQVCECLDRCIGLLRNSNSFNLLIIGWQVVRFSIKGRSVAACLFWTSHRWLFIWDCGQATVEKDAVQFGKWNVLERSKVSSAYPRTCSKVRQCENMRQIF